ncbi:MAG: hypothetical protein IJI34_08930 [Clostridia bacterium]|nr:hypothetical protein [Clostridia bacterium]
MNRQLQMPYTPAIALFVFLQSPLQASKSALLERHRFGTVPLRTEWKRHRIPFDLAPYAYLSKVVRIFAPLNRPKGKVVREVAPSDPSVVWIDERQGGKKP